MATLQYLLGYAPALQEQVKAMLDQGKLRDWLLQRHPDVHGVRSDRALYDYVMDLKGRFMRSGEPLSKVAFDNKLHVIQHALGTHTTISRVQGSKLKAKREIRVATMFREVPEAFLRMIVVHELAHMREKAHDKAFYQLCTHMEPQYHQYEFELRCALLLAASDAAGLPWRAQSSNVDPVDPT